MSKMAKRLQVSTLYKDLFCTFAPSDSQHQHIIQRIFPIRSTDHCRSHSEDVLVYQIARLRASSQRVLSLWQPIKYKGLGRHDTLS